MNANDIDVAYALGAFSSISEDDLDKIVNGSHWIPTLIYSIHSLPIGFVLVSADTPSIGYPVSCVNKYVEKMTGEI
jgi:hypothetical protein